MKMRSLAIKLTFAFLLISILGTATVALLVNWQTRRQFDDLVNELYLEDLQTAQERLATIYTRNGSWQGVENSFYGGQTVGTAPDNRPPRRLPITLVNSERVVIIGNHHLQPGEILPAAIVAQGLPIAVDGVTAGWVLLDSFGEEGGFSDSPEARFLASLNTATLWSALGTALVGLLAGVLLARTISHPISELQDATERMARGKLGTQVAVRSNDEVGQLAASFNQMSADLARANEVRRQMTADIAHDLRTPLSVIQGYTEALDDGKLPGNSEIYGAMHKQVKHLNRLVEDLRTLSLADAGQLSLHPQSVQPRDLLEHTLLLYAPQAEQKKIDLRLQLPPADLPPVTMDLDRMVQVLGNLISNAIRHTPAGGAIQLAAKPDPQGVQIAVTDSGAGINPEDLPHVFDRFYRGNKARSDSGESGLGLAIARSIVAAHGGQIAVASTLGQGTTFTITLPPQNQ